MRCERKEDKNSETPLNVRSLFLIRICLWPHSRHIRFDKSGQEGSSLLLNNSRQLSASSATSYDCLFLNSASTSHWIWMDVAFRNFILLNKWRLDYFSTIYGLLFFSWTFKGCSVERNSYFRIVIIQKNVISISYLWLRWCAYALVYCWLCWLFPFRLIAPNSTSRKEALFQYLVFLRVDKLKFVKSALF